MSEQAKQQIGISAIQADLVNGLTRKQIADKYGMSKASLDRMFKHPKLASMRTKKPDVFELIDDAPDFVPTPARKKKTDKQLAAETAAEAGEATGATATSQAAGAEAEAEDPLAGFSAGVKTEDGAGV